MSKTLIAYFSHTGENYFKGQIRNIEKGNTQGIAEKLADMTGSDLFEIKAVKAYPHVYNDCTDVAKREKNANARPELVALKDISGYDTILLGYPNWWSTMPMPVFTFLESADFMGKKIYPFCTHEGSAEGSSVRDLKRVCPNAMIGNSIAIYGSEWQQADEKLKKWLKTQDISIK